MHNNTYQNLPRNFQEAAREVFLALAARMVVYLALVAAAVSVYVYFYAMGETAQLIASWTLSCVMLFTLLIIRKYIGKMWIWGVVMAFGAAMLIQYIGIVAILLMVPLWGAFAATGLLLWRQRKWEIGHIMANFFINGILICILLRLLPHFSVADAATLPAISAKEADICCLSYFLAAAYLIRRQVIQGATALHEDSMKDLFPAKVPLSQTMADNDKEIRSIPEEVCRRTLGNLYFLAFFLYILFWLKFL